MYPGFKSQNPPAFRVDSELNDHNSKHGTGIAKPDGVQKAEAAHRVMVGRHKILLAISIGLAAYIYSLDRTTSLMYLAFGGAAFNDHSLVAAVQVAQIIIAVCGKPFIAKLADALSRPIAYSLVVIFYVIGCIIIASAQSIETIAAGMVIYAIGWPGLQLLLQVILADITTLKWRGLSWGLVATPVIIHAFTGFELFISVMMPGGPGWRWGYGMFAILVPVTVTPLIATLGWAQHKAKTKGLLKADSGVPRTKTQKTADVFTQVDILGLLILSGGIACVLLPLTLTSRAGGGWHDPSMIAIFTVGPILLILFGFYEWRYASHPIVPMKFLRNKAVVGAALIGFFNCVLSHLTSLYLRTFVLLIKEWEPRHLDYFISAQAVACAVFGVLAGIIMRAVHGYKWILVAGLAIRLFGIGLMVRSRGARGTTAELVIIQIIQGLGGGFAAVASQVGAQASVLHGEVAVVIAMVLVVVEVGGAIGIAIAVGIWRNIMPKQLEVHLPGVNEDVRDRLLGSVTTIFAYPSGDPTHEGVIQAYDETMKALLTAAAVIAVIPLVLSLFMPDYYLGDTQNAIEKTDLIGETVPDVPKEVI